MSNGFFSLNLLSLTPPLMKMRKVPEIEATGSAPSHEMMIRHNDEMIGSLSWSSLVIGTHRIRTRFQMVNTTFNFKNRLQPLQPIFEINHTLQKRLLQEERHAMPIKFTSGYCHCSHQQLVIKPHLISLIYYDHSYIVFL